MADFIPRPSQQNILQYRGGRLGIAAVPGAGKTHILSALAAQIIRSGQLQDDQEVLIVTLVNSAVDNFETRIKRFFENPIEALYKYRVRTLHGLAHDIVREKPSSVGLEKQFSIIDEREAEFIRREAVHTWLSSNSLDDYLDPGLERYKLDRVKREQLPVMVDSLANAFIRSAKDRLLTPEKLRAKLNEFPAPLPLAELGWSIYSDYQRALAYRGAVDFDDLIRLALTLLQNDEEYLERLRFRYPFILEDEAQDSSKTQQDILGLISGDHGNWVRVGDPNQAIFETFTTADPDLLRDFIKMNPNADMPESGRSQPAVIALANHLMDWVISSHPDENARGALSLPHIEPVPAGYQPVNPDYDPAGIRLIDKKYAPEEELEAVVKSVKNYVDSFADQPVENKPTIAVLVSRNQRGVEVVEALRKRGLEAVELISSTANTRAAAGSLNHLLNYLADPQSSRKLSKAYEVWRRDWRDGASKEPIDEETAALRRQSLAATTNVLKRIVHVEDFIAPAVPGIPGEWLDGLSESEAQAALHELGEFRRHVERWLNAVLLPIDQLVLTLAQDIFNDSAELALAHKLALALRQTANDHFEWRLPELAAELAVIAKNERRFIGFSDDDSGFDPERHRGKVVVTTMHKAKGLEWDRVYLMSVNNYDFPSNQPGDTFISEKWFIRGKLNLEAEALAQLSTLEATGEYNIYDEGQATRRARLDYVNERLRLLYVGITRAKRDLILTWNSGRNGSLRSSDAFIELYNWQAANH